MKNNEFYMVLPSNSSMDYYSDNTASRYTTLLPKHIELEGEWVVGLSEIQFPCNFLHLRDKKETSILLFTLPKKVTKNEIPPDSSYTEFMITIPTAVFKNISDLITVLNRQEEIKRHFQFEYYENEGFVSVVKHCDYAKCGSTMHQLELSDKISDILGFARGRMIFHEDTLSQDSALPASLPRGLPTSLFVYSDICSPYVTGDVQSSLLRVVPFNSSVYIYGATQCVTFPNPHYISLIRHSFRTIEIDIRSHLGELIPFQQGPLNVTLHFKRVD